MNAVGKYELMAFTFHTAKSMHGEACIKNVQIIDQSTYNVIGYSKTRLFIALRA